MLNPNPSPSPPQLRPLFIILFCLWLTTTIHYAHNYLRAEDYPPVPGIYTSARAYRIGITISYPFYTFCGIRGYHLYKPGNLQTALIYLASYASLGIRTPAHFFGGVPQIPWFWFLTNFTDFFAGLALAVFCYKTYVSNTRF
ncbi:uncharacterized protein BO72DRAFT_514229 [Aspergillus fijiensis CBS 313.89]|uniref:Uncharacterized protein n=1 Tax=Aspergillus fijiensis CBS 313.89 TaxID=1448319 RepID=A0A8G1RZT3_9EURO|nr:uncharacterized protein BO72DRAFT_514229 [Aspergillus fijiensis CBS 313.89]RAK81884.1 hypothetical protein BO72DRAFT_514229 [Aspergillus fijiensis CBS 313.89]